MERPVHSGPAPRVFFRGEYVCRTLSGTMAVISGLVAGAIAAGLALYIQWQGEDRLADVVSVIFGCVALVFGGLGLRELWGWIRNRRIAVEINADGILYGSQFWAWDEVRSFVGTRYDNGVCLEFTPSRRGVWGGGGLPTTPLLTDEEYVALARELGQCLSTRFPDVVVATVPENAISDS